MTASREPRPGCARRPSRRTPGLLPTGRYPDPAGRQDHVAGAGRRGQLPPGHRDTTPPPAGGGAGSHRPHGYRSDPRTAELPDGGARVPAAHPFPGHWHPGHPPSWELTTEQAAQRYPELAELVGWEWSYLSTVDLLVGVCPMPSGVHTLYVDSPDSATAWTAAQHGTPQPTHGHLADIVRHAGRATGTDGR